MLVAVVASFPWSIDNDPCSYAILDGVQACVLPCAVLVGRFICRLVHTPMIGMSSVPQPCWLLLVRWIYFRWCVVVRLSVFVCTLIIAQYMQYKRDW